jgi:serine/threonine protein kinase
MREDRLRIVGDYIIGKCIQSTPFGFVHLAMHQETGARVAIVRIRKSKFSEDRELFERIEREIALLRLFHHSNLPKLLTVLDSGRHISIITEYMGCDTLTMRMNPEFVLSPPDAMVPFRQLIYGLEYVHHHSICHGNLNLENLFLDESNNLRIADFSCAECMRSPLTRTPC